MAKANTQRFEEREVEVTKKGAQVRKLEEEETQILKLSAQDHFFIEVEDAIRMNLCSVSMVRYLDEEQERRRPQGEGPQPDRLGPGLA